MGSDVVMGGDLILGATNSINLRGNLKAISFFDYSANDFDIFLAAPVLFEGDLKLNGNWISNDGGNEGIQILNNGKVRLSSDLILPTGGINITDNTTGISFFNPGPNQYEIFMAQPVLLNSGMKLNGSWMSNDGGNEGISIDNNGVVTTSNLLQVGGYVAANNYLSISNNGQALTLAADEANNRIVLDVGGSGHSGDAIVLGEVGTGSKNPVLMQGNLVVGGLSSPSSNYKLTVNGEPAANGYRQFTNYSDRRLKHNIQNMGSALERIAQLRPVSFQYTAQTGYDSTALATTFRGFIAQELQEVFPDMVGEIQLADNTYLDANLSALPIYLVKAVQEQQTLIGELREANQAQEERIEAQNEKLAQQQSDITALKTQLAKIDRLEALVQQLQAQGTADNANSISSGKR
ncbi:MAG: tail fiber domain-containing protein [Bacteroidota bacterium]